MSKQSNQRYRKEVMKNKQDSIKSSVSKSDAQSSTLKNGKEGYGHTDSKE